MAYKLLLDVGENKLDLPMVGTRIWALIAQEWDGFARRDLQDVRIDDTMESRE